jgi:hypothetical protein
MKSLRLLFLLLLPVALNGCLLIPGKFNSTMDLRRDGRFAFAYKGEIIFQIPDEKLLNAKADGSEKTWTDKMAVCWSDDSKEIDNFGIYADDKPEKEKKGKGRAKSRKLWSNWAASADEEKSGPAPAATPAKPVPTDQKPVASPVPPPPAPAATAADKAATAADAAVKEAAKPTDPDADSSDFPDEDATDGADVTEAETPIIRPCTKKEIADLRAEWQETRDKQTADAKQYTQMFASMFGLDPSSPDSMSRFAADLSKHAGWNSVVYKGDGVFLVDYQQIGRLDQDFVFPLLPDQQMFMPFVMIKRRADGSALVETPGFAVATNGGLLGAMVAMVETRMNSDKSDKPPRNPILSVDGKFTITTDGEILTNNTVNGPAALPIGRQLIWEFNDAKDPAPKALIKLR